MGGGGEESNTYFAIDRNLLTLREINGFMVKLILLSIHRGGSRVTREIRAG
jgi:hypothetical protein